MFYIIKKAVVRLYIPHRPLKNNYPTRIFDRTYFSTQHDYSGQYAYFFSTIVNPIRLFRPIRLLGIQEYMYIDELTIFLCLMVFGAQIPFKKDFKI